MQGGQIRFRIAVLQEFLHIAWREGYHDGGISLLIRKFGGGAEVTQPPQVNPMTIDATAPIATPCRRRVRDSPRRIEGTCMAFAFRKRDVRRTRRARPQKRMLI
ncbi:MAG: hypothetical protein WCD69_15070, partial [Xanthobacteraceae bacterium]